MTSKRSKDLYDARKELQREGWDVSKASRFNSGSETVAHSVCKHLSAHYLRHELGYKVAFETTHQKRGEIDVLAWGQRETICIECETNPNNDVVRDKLDRYIHGTPIDEMFLLNVDEMPHDIHGAHAWIDEQTYQLL